MAKEILVARQLRAPRAEHARNSDVCAEPRGTVWCAEPQRWGIAWWFTLPDRCLKAQAV